MVTTPKDLSLIWGLNFNCGPFWWTLEFVNGRDDAACSHE